MLGDNLFLLVLIIVSWSIVVLLFGVPFYVKYTGLDVPHCHGCGVGTLQAVWTNCVSTLFEYLKIQV